MAPRGLGSGGRLMNAAFALSFAVLALSPEQKDVMEKRWIDTLWPPAREVSFSPTTLQEREAFEKLIPAILDAAPDTKVPPKALGELAKSAGFTLESWSEGSETYWTLREQ